MAQFYLLLRIGILNSSDLRRQKTNVPTKVQLFDISFSLFIDILLMLNPIFQHRQFLNYLQAGMKYPTPIIQVQALTGDIIARVLTVLHDSS
jgi:hypothetical protein